MNSKKLGMFAAAALTVLASQANAGEAKKDAKGEVCANGCGGNGHDCAGYELKAEHKTQEACTNAKGKWMSKAVVEANMKKAAAAATGGAPKAAPADAHKHPH